MPTTPPSAPRLAAPATGKPSLWLGALSVVLAVAALGFAVAAWVRSAPEAAPVYSEQQVADAKKAVCDAFAQVDRALTASSLGGGADSPNGVVIGINVRAALTASAQYLSTKVNEHPATPSDIAELLKSASNTYQEMAISQFGRASDARLDEIAEVGNPRITALEHKCQ